MVGINIGLAILSLIIGSLGGLIWYANRSGRNAAQLKADDEALSLAQQTIRVVQNMAQAEADKPNTAEELINRLNNKKS
ncbi:hypothetical protein GT348_03860 [Aristophania vespae]|uniref:Uncharacterized protein n=1 Tax=Aristophania vespae TaxID=2697033 RepID=A0A6P1NF54_9PROT|nr:hypothetical protein [Aristophania vespae]QHI95517.1 hypothetical protein GT348_03860 [Aristophania vespae]